MMSDIKICSESVIRTGFGILSLDQGLVQSYNEIIHQYSSIGTAMKQAFSFAEETDGFFPFGAEYSQHEDHPDLCERFCYWPAHAARRAHHEVVNTPFYTAAQEYEVKISALSTLLMDSICDEFGAPPLDALRSSSYLQLCVYGAQTSSPDRQFAQDPHEDGHLLSFIKPNEDGLVLVRGSSLEPVRLLKNEVAVLAGSLLTDLSDSAIPAAYHAVLASERPAGRSSLIYFVNPDPEQVLTGFRRKQPIHLGHVTNARHVSFGNRPLQQA